MFAPSLDAVIYHGAERKLELKHDVILTTYAIMRIDIEELKKKIDDYNYLQMADTVKTDAEKYLGTTIDFKG